jgi:hypothetical protein
MQHDAMAGLLAHTLNMLVEESDRLHCVKLEGMGQCPMNTLSQCLYNISKEKDACQHMAVQLTEISETLSRLRLQIHLDIKAIFSDIHTSVSIPQVDTIEDTSCKLLSMLDKLSMIGVDDHHAGRQGHHAIM